MFNKINIIKYTFYKVFLNEYLIATNASCQIVQICIYSTRVSRVRSCHYQCNALTQPQSGASPLLISRDVHAAMLIPLLILMY